MSTSAADAVALARRARGPIVRPTADPECLEVTFVHHDREARLHRVGLFCPGLPGGYTLLDALGDGVFTATVPLPRGTRVTYHFTLDPPPDLDGAALFALAHSPTARRIDRFNPRVDQVQLRGLRVRIVESLLTLPGAAQAPSDRPAPGVPAGSVTELSVHSHRLGRRKDVTVHLPAGHATPAGLPVVLLLQSNEEWGSPAMIDNLVATAGVPPFVAVVTADRGFTARLRDLSGRPEHTRFVVDELWPMLRARCGVTAEEATVAGYSAGGVAAAALAVDRPRLLPRLVVVSGALHLASDMAVLRAGNDSTRMHARYENAPQLPRRTYLAAGTFEDFTEDAILRGTRELARILDRRGADVRLEVGPTSHDTVSARAYLAAGLRHVLTA